MTKRRVSLSSLVLVAVSGVACSTGASDDSPSTFSDGFTSNPEGDGDGDGDSETGDGDGETTTGDGDGDPSTGDGDGDATGDGDGDVTGDGDGDVTGDGDGDVDPCPLICDGMSDSTPASCAAPYIIGRTDAKAGFFYGGNTQSSMDSDNERCGPNDDPANWDSGKDHFFRIFLVEGDVVTAVQNPNGWDARLKIHDEAECVGSAKECSTTADPAEILEYEALKTDWYTIVADGQSAGFMDWGDYTLTVDLVQGANVDDCGCP